MRRLFSNRRIFNSKSLSEQLGFQPAKQATAQWLPPVSRAGGLIGDSFPGFRLRYTLGFMLTLALRAGTKDFQRDNARCEIGDGRRYSPSIRCISLIRVLSLRRKLVLPTPSCGRIH
jgi:hypothetical protein